MTGILLLLWILTVCVFPDGGSDPCEGLLKPPMGCSQLRATGIDSHQAKTKTASLLKRGEGKEAAAAPGTWAIRFTCSLSLPEWKRMMGNKQTHTHTAPHNIILGFEWGQHYRQQRKSLWYKETASDWKQKAAINIIPKPKNLNHKTMASHLLLLNSVSQEIKQTKETL